MRRAVIVLTVLLALLGTAACSGNLIDDRANALLAAVPAKGRDSPAATPSVPETTKPVGPDGSASRPPNPDQAARPA